MDIADYFDKPAKLDLDNPYTPESEMFVSKLVSENYNVALIGVDSEVGSVNKGCDVAPDEIRKQLYALRGGLKDLRIADLGNLKKGEKSSDTYYALRDVVSELVSNAIIPIIIGGSQDLSLSVFEGLKDQRSELNMVVVDPRVDVGLGEVPFGSNSYLNKILEDEVLFRLDLLGYQTYLCSNTQLSELVKRNHWGTRLGILRANPEKTEPIFRDSDFVSVDMAVVRQSDAPGNAHPLPNGLFGEELCQLARYAGFSDRISAFGIFETNPFFDNNGQTSELAAEVIWHFLEALDNRYGDYPKRELSNYTKYVVPDMDGDEEMVFYNNNLNNRWWIEIPTSKGKCVFSCTYQDYRLAKENQIPDIWMMYYMK
ncbi:MAG: formimidoylglutamase [Paludibacteraceae bacterium]|nr:formimidoylglutamase [Paludibacteraceae bacterium]